MGAGEHLETPPHVEKTHGVPTIPADPAVQGEAGHGQASAHSVLPGGLHLEAHGSRRRLVGREKGTSTSSARFWGRKSQTRLSRLDLLVLWFDGSLNKVTKPERQWVLRVVKRIS